jgi:hypothetical protein
MSYEEVLDELLALVDQGFLHMGVGEDGECVFWPTDLGSDALGMDEIPLAPAS